jgi:RNA polymerase sigma factor (sigma-70 family)
MSAMTAGRIRPLLPQLQKLAARFDDRTPDRDLLRRFGAERDESAFAEIVRRHGPMVLRTCRRVLHDGHDAEDICQAAFLLLARKAASAGWHDSIAGWLFQTAYRLSLKARTTAGRRARHEAHARPLPQPDPVAELTVRELQVILDDELSRLPEKYRAPILLCCLEGRSRDEAARCLGWTVAAVKDRLERGRERLRIRLSRRGVLLGTSLLSAWLLEGAAQATCASVAPQAVARAALSIATGQATLGSLLPARVAALAKGVTTTMFVRKVTIMVAVSVAVGLCAAGVVMGLPGGSPPVQAQAPPAKPAPADPTPMPPPKPAAADAGLVQPEAMPLGGHKGAVRAVAFAPDGKTLATAGADKTVRVWDLATRRQIHKLEQPDEAAGVAFSPDGKTLAATSAGKTGWVVLWEAATGNLLWQAGATAGACGTVAFSADGKALAVGFGPGAVMRFDMPSGKEMWLAKGMGAGTPAAAAFSPDGKLLAVGDDGGGIHLLDPAGRLVSRWRVSGPVTALAFLPGDRLAAADGGKAVHSLDASNGAKKAAFEGNGVVRALALSTDGKRLVTAGAGGAVLLWDVASGKEERRFFARGVVNAVAFSPDGKRLATAGEDGAAVWDLTRDEKPLPKDLKLTAKELDALWSDLASDEGGKAYAAARLLRADPARSVPFLQEHLKRKADGPDEKKLKQLIADLDADEFEKRAAATNELEKLGRQAESALRAALAAGPSAEVKTRVERLLNLLGEGRPLTAEQQRDVRAVRVLEQVGTPEAHKLLEALAKDAPGWWVAQEAKEALQRLAPGDKKP